MIEEWKDIKDYENLYQVSNLGRVKSLKREIIYSDGRKHTYKEKILKPRKNKYGYLVVCLCNNGNRKEFFVHRLVALAFIPNPDNKPHIDHIDTNPLNNVYTNLHWVTPKENNNNELTKQHVSEAMKGKKISEETKEKRRKKIYCVELDKVFNSIKEASEELGIFATTISAVCKGKRKTVGGYHFMYYHKRWIERELN